ncbi:unnamed protein product [Gadus morhua 'NCC']
MATVALMCVHGTAFSTLTPSNHRMLRRDLVQRSGSQRRDGAVWIGAWPAKMYCLVSSTNQAFPRQHSSLEPAQPLPTDHPLSGQDRPGPAAFRAADRQPRFPLGDQLSAHPSTAQRPVQPPLTPSQSLRRGGVGQETHHWLRSTSTLQPGRTFQQRRTRRPFRAEPAAQ